MDSVSKTKVFIPHDEFVWVTGELISESENGNVEVRIIDQDLPQDNKSIQLNLTKIFNGTATSLPLQNIDIPKDGVNDMCSLSYLHEPSILDNLRRRFFGKKPYTFTGDICVAVNPYQWLELYSDKMRQEYSHKYPHELPPHVYATSAAAYRGITSQNLNQCILVSGESGAGKTETVKILMGHLASIASKSGDKTVDRLLKANPLLESFGNAKTVRNDNSSRFGRFSQLEFDGQNVLVGSKCITYLLEKSRVVGQSPGERNYHIMYEILAAPTDFRSYLFLENFNLPRDYYYMNMGDVRTSIIEGVRDGDRFVHTLDALELLGVQGETKTMLLRALASVLHLGQLSFQAQASNPDAAELLPRGQDSAVDEAVDACCSLLGITPDVFSSTIATRTIEVESKKLSVPLKLEQVLSGRDALAKELYARVFGWLVLVINFNTSYVTNGGNPSSSCSTVSLLDIFGFECFQVNRFEQLCINYANEKLQQKFATDVFKTVQREYAEEGIRLDSIIFKDNADVLEMIEGRGGLITNLAEECMIPRGSDLNYVSKVTKAFSNHAAFFVSRTVKDQFGIRHYAGSVSYTVTGFVDTNKDTLPNNMAEMLQVSTNPLLQRLFSYPSLFQLTDPAPFLAGDKEQNEEFLMLRRAVIPSSRRGSTTCSAPDIVEAVTSSSAPANRLRAGLSINGNDPPDSSRRLSSRRRGTTAAGMGEAGASTSFVLAESVAVKFQNQLATLMDTISATQVQYVRCIKPNPNKSNKEFYRPLVVEQLRSGGMIAAVKISRQAYPNRLPYVEFLERYKYFQSKAWHDHKRKDIQQNNRGIDLFKESIELCKSMLLTVFSELKDEMDPQPKNDLELYQFGFTKIYYSSLMMKHLEILRNRCVASYVVRMQALAKMFIYRRRFQRQKAYVILVQKSMRGSMAKKKYRVLLFAHKVEMERKAREAAELARLAKEAEDARLKDEAEMEKERLRLEEEARAERARRQAKEEAEIARRLQEHREQVERMERERTIELERLEREKAAEEERQREAERLAILARETELQARLSESQMLLEQAQADAELARVKALELAAAEAERVKREAEEREAEMQRQLQAAKEVELQNALAEAAERERRKVAEMEAALALAEQARIKALEDATAEVVRLRREAEESEASKTAELCKAHEERDQRRIAEMEAAVAAAELARLKALEDAAEETERIRLQAEAEKEQVLAEAAERERIKLAEMVAAEAVRLKALEVAAAEAELARQAAAAEIERVRIDIERRTIELQVEAEAEKARLLREAIERETELQKKLAEAQERENARIAEIAAMSVAEAARLKVLEDAVAEAELEKERVRRQVDAEKVRLKEESEAEKERFTERAKSLNNKVREAEIEVERVRLDTEQREAKALLDKERGRVVAAEEAERMRLETEMEKVRLRKEVEDREAAKEAELQRALAEAQKQEDARIADMTAKLTALEAARLKALEDASSEAERLRIESEANIERVKFEAEAEYERLRYESERKIKEAEAETIRLAQRALALSGKIRQAGVDTENLRIEHKKIVAETAAEAEAEKTRLRKEMLIRETSESRMKVQLESERLKRETVEEKLRGVVDAFRNPSVPATPGGRPRDDVALKIPELFEPNIALDQTTRTVQTLFELLQTPSSESIRAAQRLATERIMMRSRRTTLMGGESDSASMLLDDVGPSLTDPPGKWTQNSLHTTESPRTHVNGEHGESHYTGQLLAIRQQADDEPEDEIDALKREIQEMRQAKELAVDMLSELLLDNPHLVTTTNASVLDSSVDDMEEIEEHDLDEEPNASWREIDPWGPESYQEQLHTQLMNMIKERLLQVNIPRFVPHEGGFIEFEILYTVELQLTREPLFTAFSPSSSFRTRLTPQQTQTNGTSAALNTAIHNAPRSPKTPITVTVLRRFSDFAGLWAKLKTVRVAKPRLPKKQLLPKMGDRWKREKFLNDRKLLLDIWLNQVLLLVGDMTQQSLSHLQNFLTPPLVPQPLPPPSHPNNTGTNANTKS